MCAQKKLNGNSHLYHIELSVLIKMLGSFSNILVYQRTIPENAGTHVGLNFTVGLNKHKTSTPNSKMDVVQPTSME